MTNRTSLVAGTRSFLYRVLYHPGSHVPAGRYNICLLVDDGGRAAMRVDSCVVAASYQGHVAPFLSLPPLSLHHLFTASAVIQLLWYLLLPGRICVEGGPGSPQFYHSIVPVLALDPRCVPLSRLPP